MKLIIFLLAFATSVFAGWQCKSSSSFSFISPYDFGYAFTCENTELGSYAEVMLDGPNKEIKVAWVKHDISFTDKYSKYSHSVMSITRNDDGTTTRRWADFDEDGKYYNADQYHSQWTILRQSLYTIEKFNISLPRKLN